jgi:hypothetical protein
LCSWVATINLRWRGSQRLSVTAGSVTFPWRLRCDGASQYPHQEQGCGGRSCECVGKSASQWGLSHGALSNHRDKVKREIGMAEWSVRVFGPQGQIEAASKCLSVNRWAISQSKDGWYLKSEQDFVEGNGYRIAEEAAQLISTINTVYELFNPGDKPSLTLGDHSFVVEDGTRVQSSSKRSRSGRRATSCAATRPKRNGTAASAKPLLWGSASSSRAATRR